MPDITTAACGEMITQVAASCKISAIPDPSPAQPNYDSLATAIGGLSVALTWGAIIFAVLSLAIGFAWMRSVTREAKAEALEAVQDKIDKWLREEAPRLLRDGGEMLRYHTEDLNPETPEMDKDAADKIGEAAG